MEIPENTNPGSHSNKGKRIKVFTSFEEAENDEIMQRKRLTPLERLEQTVALIKRTYHYKPSRPYRIFFDKI